MRNLNFSATAVALLLLTSAPLPTLAGQACIRWIKLAESIQPKEFYRVARERGEVQIQLDTFEQARNLAYNFPPGKALGANFADYTKRERFIVTMESSLFKGKPAGWQQRLPDGSLARIRFDWDEKKGAHFNVEYMKVMNKNTGAKENYKAAIEFLCQGRKCTQEDALKLVK